MHTLPQKVVEKLMTLNQRPLTEGELILLSKVISDYIPIMDSVNENVKIHVLSFRSYIDYIIYIINDFTYIDDIAKDKIISNIEKFVLWRTTIAYNPSSMPIYSDNKDILEYVTGITKYIDKVTLQYLEDMKHNINYMYLLFADVVSSAKKETGYANKPENK